jgi:hypothetical protein
MRQARRDINLGGKHRRRCADAGRRRDQDQRREDDQIFDRVGMGAPRGRPKAVAVVMNVSA